MAVNFQHRSNLLGSSASLVGAGEALVKGTNVRHNRTLIGLGAVGNVLREKEQGRKRKKEKERKKEKGRERKRRKRRK